MTTRCPNCGAELQGPYCFRCGQQDKDIRRFFLSLVNEVFEDLFDPKGRTARTLFSLFFRPGYLTSEYSAGRRARYLPPVRLYLVTSFMFFLFLSISNAIEGPMDLKSGIVIDGDGTGGGDRVITFDDIRKEAEQSAREEAAADLAAKGVPATVPLDLSELTVKTRAPDVPATTPQDRSEASDAEEIAQGIDDAAAKFQVDLLSESANERARDVLRGQGKKLARVVEEDPDSLVATLINMIPPIMFILLPLFALLLKLTFLSSGRYYSEHLILAVHTHSFVFLVLLVARIVEFSEGLRYIGVVAGWIGIAINVWIPLYLYLTFKNYYAQDTSVTIAKFFLLSLMYCVLFLAVLPFAMIWGFLTL